MPIEKRPLNPLPPGPRPGSRVPPHRITDNETLASIAHKYGISERHLLMHNFGTVDEREINWYLRERVGCNLPTHDQKNWRFSNTARPGLVYIPIAAAALGTLEIPGHVPGRINLNKPAVPIFPLVKQITFEYNFEVPKGGPAELGYWIAQGEFSVGGEIGQKDDRFRPAVTLTPEKLKAVLEQKLGEKVTATFSVLDKLDEKSLETFLSAIKSGKKDEIAKEVSKHIQLKLTANVLGWRCVNFSVGPEFSKTFANAALRFEWQGTLIENLDGKIGGTLKLKAGLSKKGWAWVVAKAGPKALGQYLTSLGENVTALTQWLAAEGVFTAAGIAAGALAGTAVLVLGCAELVQYANRNGKSAALVSWYLHGYFKKVFPLAISSDSHQYDIDEVSRQRFIHIGEADALQDARANLARLNNPAAQGTAEQAVDAYRMLLEVQSKYDDTLAMRKLQLSLEGRVKSLLP